MLIRERDILLLINLGEIRLRIFIINLIME